MKNCQVVSEGANTWFPTIGFINKSHGISWPSLPGWRTREGNSAFILELIYTNILE